MNCIIEISIAEIRKGKRKMATIIPVIQFSRWFADRKRAPAIRRDGTRALAAGRRHVVQQLERSEKLTDIIASNPKFLQNRRGVPADTA